MKVFILFALVFNAYSALLVKKITGPYRSEIVDVQKVDRIIKEDSLVVRDIPYFLPEGAPASTARYQEVLIKDESMYRTSFQSRSSSNSFSSIPGSEVRTMVDQGPSENRINLAFLGDGYTESEKERFFEDVDRLIYDLFGETTFASYLPLFNVYAIFTPSDESGISDIFSKDTIFGLYRNPQGSKRAIMPGSTRMLERAIDQIGVQIDYPIVIANDDFYGGLGGRYAITTRSVKSGSVVLRHELGHNFGNVGEEYDGGYVYSGANSSRGNNIKWPQWVDGAVKYNRGKQIMGSYVWQDLSEPYNDSFRIPDDSNGPYTLEILLSSVGWASDDEVSVTIDGVEYPYAGDYTADRSFFNITAAANIGAGKHDIKIEQNINDGDNVLAYANAYAYPADYDFTEDKIDAFATYNVNGAFAGWRPSHHMCLMRNMKSMDFCPVDLENMWKRFLKVMSLIDDVEVSNKVEVLTPDLDLEITWYKKVGYQYKEVTSLKNKRSWTKSSQPSGDYKVRVDFETSEVRDYNNEFYDEMSFSI